MSPLIEALRADLTLATQADGLSVAQAVELIEKRLGPVLKAAEKLRRIDDAVAILAEFTSASAEYDLVMKKASAP